ncbi:MAG: MarR family transcriptional regulator [Bifidobacteriaceae bacterium]|jgi:DNA-binding MarR family transcriptional regulator|nr:MarR family transcriptional regulator [Bifidobacteriaceae bacterium]
MDEATERERVCDQLKRVMERLHTLTIFDDLMRKKTVVLTPQQFRVMGLVAVGGPTRSGELASALGVSRATMTGLLDRLEQAGLVERSTDPRDARGRLATATEAGRDALRGLLETAVLKDKGFVDDVAVADLRALLQGLSAVLAAISARLPAADQD